MGKTKTTIFMPVAVAFVIASRSSKMLPGAAPCSQHQTHDNGDDPALRKTVGPANSPRTSHLQTDILVAFATRLVVVYHGHTPYQVFQENTLARLTTGGNPMATVR